MPGVEAGKPYPVFLKRRVISMIRQMLQENWTVNLVGSRKGFRQRFRGLYMPIC